VPSSRSFFLLGLARMICLVHGSTIDTSKRIPSDALRQFVAGLRWRHAFGRCCSAGLRASLLASVPVVLVAWLLPAKLAVVALVAIVLVASSMLLGYVLAWLRGRKVLSAIRESLSMGGGGMLTLSDELVTWLEFAQHEDGRPVAVDAGMLRWLERDVHDRLDPNRRGVLRAVTRPRLGRWRWLVPAIVLLLLVWLLAAFITPPWSGALGGKPNQTVSGIGSGGAPSQGEADEQLPSSSKQEEVAQEQPEEQSQPEEPSSLPPPDTQDDSASTPDDPNEIPPLIDKPEEQRFVVPDFIGDGPTRRALMHAAELDEQVGKQNVSPQQLQAAASGDPAAAQVLRMEFERARERALRSRHVPAVERAMVRRFFDSLQVKAK
jgi:hypothetical protein